MEMAFKIFILKIKIRKKNLKLTKMILYKKIENK